MLVKTFSSAVYGVDAVIITVEVNVTDGLYTFLVGLPDEALKECIPRVESAIKTNEYYMPRTKVIINLAPAGIRKSGAAFDLPIALGILAASGQIDNPESLKDYCILGELGLDGAIHPIKGALPIAIQVQQQHFKALILPARNAREAAVVRGLTVLPFTQLRDLIDFLNGNALGPVPANADEELEFLFPGQYFPQKRDGACDPQSEPQGGQQSTGSAPAAPSRAVRLVPFTKGQTELGFARSSSTDNIPSPFGIPFADRDSDDASGHLKPESYPDSGSISNVDPSSAGKGPHIQPDPDSHPRFDDEQNSQPAHGLGPERTSAPVPPRSLQPPPFTTTPVPRIVPPPRVIAEKKIIAPGEKFASANSFTHLNTTPTLTSAM